MLIQFSIKNFRSIGERVTFSTVASPSATKSSYLTVETGNTLAPNVLTTSVLLGPNASGKSTIASALKFFQNLVVNSAKETTQGERIKYRKNAIAPGFEDEPSELEMVFSHDGEVFQYGFCFNNERILEEWLFARTSKAGSRTRDIFYREFDEESDNYNWHLNEGQIPGEKENWKSATRENSLFLSTAVQLNSQTLVKPFSWIREYVHVIGANQRLDREFTAQMLLGDAGHREKVMTLLNALDLKIVDFRVETGPAKMPDEVKAMLQEDFLKQISANLSEQTSYEVYAIHTNSDGKRIELPLTAESDGTRAIFGLVGPILDVLEKGYTLFVDELSNSLHPLALKALVSVFQNRDFNKSGAQLFFTSHETSIISKKFLHRDQIWFVDRPDGESTQLKALSEYNVRELEAFQKSYLGGRFRAIPNVRSFVSGS